MYKNKRINNKKRIKKSRVLYRGLRSPKYSNLNYQFNQKLQTMGPGKTTRNSETTVTINTNTFIRVPLYSFINNQEFKLLFRTYKYVYIRGIMITQNNINITNEQNNLYIKCDLAGKPNTNDSDITKDDAAKILPNLGRKRFMFRYPRAMTPLYTINAGTRYIDMSNFNATEIFYDTLADQFMIPGYLDFYNLTSTARSVRVVISFIFRGSMVINYEEEAKTILKDKYDIKEKEKDN